MDAVRIKKAYMRFVFLVWCVAFLVWIDNSAQQYSSDKFASIGNQTVTTEEFERIFNKNNNLNSVEKQTVEEYLQMFINYKLKVAAAIDAGYDTLTSFRNELKGYRDQLAKPYLTDNSVTDELVREAYQRMHTEVNVSHIMVGMSQNPSPQDTLAAYTKIMSIRKRILAGEPFEKVAAEVSDDPSAKKNGGNLGYITAFQIPIYSFESAAFNNKAGELSLPIRTRFGYHLIKTMDKRPARGEVRVAHIMMLIPQGSVDSVLTSKEKRIREIYKQLQEGKDFTKLAKEQSEDRGTAQNGGELPWFGTGQMIPEFQEAAFKLENPGDISEPVRSFYGWHIIKLLEKRGIPDFEAVKNDLKNKILRDERAQAGDIAFLAKLKTEYSFSENKSLLKPLYTNQSAYKGEWKPDTTSNSKVLFSFGNEKITLKAFADHLRTLQPPDTSVSIAYFVDNAYNDFVSSTLKNYENNQLEGKYPEFRNLMQEYHDGILLFNITDTLVWSKANKDTAGLETFFNANRASYTWPARVEAILVDCKTPEIAQKALAKAKKLKNPEKINKELTALVCDSVTGQKCISVFSQKFAKGDNPIIDSIEWKKGFTKIFEKSGRYSFVLVNALISSGPKTLEEAKGQAISDYQNYLEKQWIEELRKKYPVTINQEILTYLKQKYAGKK